MRGYECILCSSYISVLCLVITSMYFVQSVGDECILRRYECIVCSSECMSCRVLIAAAITLFSWRKTTDQGGGGGGFGLGGACLLFMYFLFFKQKKTD